MRTVQLAKGYESVEKKSKKRSSSYEIKEF